MPGANERSAERGKCIIVEDDDALRRLMTRCALAEGFEVVEMSTAEGAWDVEAMDRTPIPYLPASCMTDGLSEYPASIGRSS